MANCMLDLEFWKDEELVDWESSLDVTDDVGDWKVELRWKAIPNAPGSGNNVG